MRFLPHRPRLALVASAAIWASHNIAGAWLTASLHPYVANLLRATLAAAFFVPLLWRAIRRGASVQARHVPRLTAAALCLAVFFLGFYVALGYTAANHVAVLLCLGPAVTTVLAVPYLGERLTPRQAAGILAAMAGALWIGFINHNVGPGAGTWLGTAAAGAAMLGFSHYALLSKPLLKAYPAPFVLALVNLAGAAILWLCLPLVPLPEGALRPGSVGPAAWLVLVYVALAMNVVSYLLFNWALKRLPAAVTHATAVYTATVFALVLARLALDEPVSLRHWLCAGVVAAGVRLASTSGPPHRRPAVPGEASSAAPADYHGRLPR